MYISNLFQIFSDQRLKQSNELLQGMKLLKLYGWEELYELAIETVRYKELSCLSKLLTCTAVTSKLNTWVMGGRSQRNNLKVHGPISQNGDFY